MFEITMRYASADIRQDIFEALAYFGTRISSS